MASSAKAQNSNSNTIEVKSEIKARSESEIFTEMIPFAIYAAIPIVVTIAIAFLFGSTY